MHIIFLGIITMVSLWSELSCAYRYLRSHRYSNDFLSAVGVSNQCDTTKIQSSVTGNQI